MRKYKFVILKNEDPFDHIPWVEACNSNRLVCDFEIIDLTSEKWLELIKDASPDFLLLKPSGKTSRYRNMYQERVDILTNDLNYKSFPSFSELRIYENKKFFSYWAKANKIPHPKTFVFYNKMEAKRFSRNVTYPLVSKLNVGASGNGVKIIKTGKELNKYINTIFTSGVSPKTGPKLNRGNILLRIINKLKNISELINRLETYNVISRDKQMGFLLLQEYINHSFEWRVVRIGDSFFAHKKIVMNNKASGSLVKEYCNPPMDLLNFVKKITDSHSFYSQAIDIFETKKGFLVNEMQCIFGQSDPYQMLVNGKPGRYIYDQSKWIFEEGDFASNQCFDLRLNFILDTF
jgi:glutathione synthase/RimK-type ligase-like ATP-grasp enzyme